ncbi:extracellular catalytic domain type 1 short-chain-length polyhydroxyalkanoate depolymerase [Lysobacter humi (ex Lee et al. 2017)]
MKFLSRLLHRTAGDRKTPNHDAAGHIARALDAAGLTRGDRQGVRGMIDRSLADAGLHVHGAPVDEATSDATQLDETSPGSQGRFLHATFANAHGRRDYRLYVPADYAADGPPRALIVMLHGCTQSPEDFATGTRMNALADRHGMLVAYPRQIGKANHAKCWNWFRPQDQRGDAGEPSILAGIIEQIAQGYRIDPRRVFVAGLSAGAAMAVVLGRTRPDLVRAIGVHSGLPYASAHDVPSALAAMQGRGPKPEARGGLLDVPVILFHGDEDRTVVPRNADAIVAAVRPKLRMRRESGQVPGGRGYTRDVGTDDTDRPWLERWTVHGAGHAWSGGDAAGTYTDPPGPDASGAMVDFFLRQ